MEEGLSADGIARAFGIERQDIRMLSPQSLAFLGDSVYELAVRTYLVEQGQRPLKKFHNEKVKLVNAAAQAGIVDIIEPELTQEELDMVRRGRGAKVASPARGASLGDYHKATGLETLCGYLYLTGRSERMIELLRRGWEHGKKS